MSEQSDWCDNMPISSYNYASVLPVTCPDPIFLPRMQGVHKNFVPGNETNSQAPSLSMHKMKYILTPTTLWCSCQVTMFLIGISNVTRLTMHVVFFRQHIATVVCNGSVGFSFMNMVGFNIYSLVFTSYNRSLSYGSHPASISALLLQLTQNAKLVHCFFRDNLGTALTVRNTKCYSDRDQ